MEKDTLPIGYKKIIDFSIDNIRLCILGEVKDLTTKTDIDDEYESYARSSSVRVKFNKNLLDDTMPNTLNICEQKEITVSNGESVVCVPLFCEYTEYILSAEIFDGNSSDEISIWHESQYIRNKLTYIFNRKTSISGGFSFDGDIGYSDFVVRVNGKDIFTLTVEVFPTKITYKKDYEEIRKDIIEEFYVLIFDALKKTYSGFQLSPDRKPTRLEFYSIFRAIYKEYINAIDYIIQKTHYMLKTEYNVMPIHKAKRVDSRSILWLQKHPEHLVRECDGRVKTDKILAVKKYVSYDTKENRFTKQIIEKTLWRLCDFKNSYHLYTEKDDEDGMKKKEDADFVKSLDLQIAELRRKLKFSFLSELECQNETIQMSLVFAMAPGYRELYRCYLKLENALKILDEVFNMSQKDIARLYEYWCFIKLNSIVSEKMYAKKKDVKHIGENELIAKLQSSNKSKIAYEINNTGEKVELYYNQEYHGLPTCLQKPDNVLAIERVGASSMKYVFDAKYKIYANPKTGVVGPKETDINTMHRYRDSIVSEEDGLYSRDMIGAYVLFPYEDADNAYMNHNFYKSINKVNIGGLPFLPSQTKYVEAIIDAMISDMDKDKSSTPKDKFDVLVKYYNELNAAKRPI